jgi:hypothetical protein
VPHWISFSFVFHYDYFFTWNLCYFLHKVYEFLYLENSIWIGVVFLEKLQCNSLQLAFAHALDNFQCFVLVYGTCLAVCAFTLTIALVVGGVRSWFLFFLPLTFFFLLLFPPLPQSLICLYRCLFFLL